MDTLFPENTADYVRAIIESAVIVIAALALFLGLKRWMLALSARANLPGLALSPVRLVLRYGILILAFCLVVQRFGVNLNAVLAVLATILAMIAIGFVAVWSVLSNVLCTFVLIVFKPFSVGDELEFPADGVSGKVVDLTLLFTTLKCADGQHLQIPNNIFFQRMFKRRTGRENIQLDEQLRQSQPIDAPLSSPTQNRA